MNNKDIIVVGVGELVFDHIFLKNIQGSTYYAHSRGGGPVWNLLANLSSLGLSTRALGVGGDDVYGRSAKSELAQLGADVEQLHLLGSKRTRVIFETLEKSEDVHAPPPHTFTATCKICGKVIPEAQLARTRQIVDKLSRSWSAVKVLCTDRLTKDRFVLVDEAHRRGVITVLDVGRIGYLRYVPAAQTAAWIGRFDVAFMPRKVAESLSRRIGTHGVAEFLHNASLAILCVSSGVSGITIYTKESDGTVTKIEKPGRIPEKYVDTSGSGDYLLSRLIYGMLRYGAHPQATDYKKSITQLIDKAATEAMLAIDEKLQALGARGHLSAVRPAQWEEKLASFRDVEVNMLRKRIEDLDQCPFCGIPKTQGNKFISQRGKATRNWGSRRIASPSNLAFLVSRMLFSTERKEAIRRCQRILKSIKTAYVVGTGGSFSAANFVALLMSKKCGIMAQALRPYDYIRTAASSDCLLIISHSGSTTDCANAIRHASSLKVRRTVLVTAAHHPKLGELLQQKEDVICYGWLDDTRERGFVSIAGTVSPCALWAAASVGGENMIRLAKVIDSKVNGGSQQITMLAEVLKSSGVIDVFGGGLAWPAMIDVESKFVEGGIGTIRLHESKDFSHGRFISVLAHHNRFARQTLESARLMIKIGRKSQYEEALAKALAKNAKFVELKTELEGVLGALEALVEVQFIVQRIAEELGKDISRPKNIPSEGLRLYRWNRGPASDTA